MLNTVKRPDRKAVSQAAVQSLPLPGGEPIGVNALRGER